MGVSHEGMGRWVACFIGDLGSLLLPRTREPRVGRSSSLPLQRNKSWSRIAERAAEDVAVAERCRALRRVALSFQTALQLPDGDVLYTGTRRLKAEAGLKRASAPILPAEGSAGRPDRASCAYFQT